MDLLGTPDPETFVTSSVIRILVEDEYETNERYLQDTGSGLRNCRAKNYSDCD